MILGTINTVTDNGVTILIDGEDTPTQKNYLILDSYNPTVNDRVLIEEVGDSYVVVGKVAKRYVKPTAEHAKTADSASSAVKLTGPIINRWLNGSWRYKHLFFKSDGTNYYIGYTSDSYVNPTDREVTWKKITTS